MEQTPIRYKMLEPYIDGKLVLHVGCIEHEWKQVFKKNWMHRFITEHAAKVIGLDILVEDVYKLNELGYDIRCADAQSFDLGMKFDVIFAGELLEHLEDFRGFFESCKRHMRKDSSLIITTPNGFGLRYLIGHLLNRLYVNSEHTCFFSEETLHFLLARHNLNVDLVKYIANDQEFVKGLTAAIMRLIEKIPKTAPTLFVVASLKDSH
jgi:SAM-dependent methyltransferase